MTDIRIQHMVSRFLSWRLPENFNPDGGISFKKTFNDHTPHPMKCEPVGTNLFDATQAEAMVRHMLEGMPVDDFRWLIEAPGTKYLAVRRFERSTNFEWTDDHNKAIAFNSRKQGEDMLDTIRQMDRELHTHENGGRLSWGKLFAFEPTLGNARVIEHGWHQLPARASIAEDKAS